MSLGFSRSRFCVAVFCLAMGGLPVQYVLGQGTQQPRRSIELSETNTAEILTNLSQLTVKKEGLRELEDQLRAINTSSGGKSLEARFNVPYYTPRPIPQKTIKELLDRQNKNWSLTPEELGTGTSSSELDAISTFTGEDSPDNKKSSLQQFYDALNHPSRPKGSSDAMMGNNPPGQTQQSDSHLQDDIASFDDDSNLPSALRAKAENLRNTVNADPSNIFNRSRPRASFDNFFGMNHNPTAANPTGTKTTVDSFLEQFKKAMDGSAAASGIDPGLESLLPAATAQKTPSYPSIDSLQLTKHHELTETTPGTVGSLPNHTIVPDINSTALNQWNSLYTPPRLELPKYTPPTPPQMNFPRRKF